MNKYKLGDISEIQSGPFGTQLHKDEYVPEGIPMLNSKNIGNGIVVEDSLDFVPEAVCERLPRYVLKKGDILFGRAGTIERHTYVDSKYDGCFQGTNCIRIRCKDKQKSRYVSYYLWLNKLKVKIENAAGGSIQSYITTDLLKDIEVEIPDDYEKRANFLSLIDEKIHNNNQINDNLEQQIKTIFTFQFLQNANTEWKQQSLAELSEMYQPKTISGKDLIADGNYFVYGANGIIGKYNQYNHSESEIAVACRGASCGSIQMTLPFSWITGNAMVVKPHSDFPYREYLYYYLLAKNPNYLCSGSAQPQLTRENLTLYSLKVPSITELNAFESYAEKVRKIIIKNQQENIELSTLRDWLLPMLMNGQATISD